MAKRIGKVLKNHLQNILNHKQNNKKRNKIRKGKKRCHSSHHIHRHKKLQTHQLLTLQ